MIVRVFRFGGVHSAVALHVALQSLALRHVGTARTSSSSLSSLVVADPSPTASEPQRAAEGAATTKTTTTRRPQQWTLVQDVERRRRKKTVVDEEFDWGATERIAPNERRIPCLFAAHRNDNVLREVDAAGPVVLRPMDPSQKHSLLQHYSRLRGIDTTSSQSVVELDGAVSVDDALAELVEKPALITDVVPSPSAAPPRTLRGGLRFTLFKENISTAEALFAISTRFNIPWKNLHSRSHFPKLAATTQKCWIKLDDGNDTTTTLSHVTPELLLSVNDMRFIGFVLRVSDPVECSESEWRADRVEYTAFVSVLRDVREDSPGALEARLASLVETGFINYIPVSVTYALCCIDVLCGRHQRAARRYLMGPTARPELKEFIKAPSVRTAVAARRVIGNAIHRRMLKAFIESSGDATAMLAACGTRGSWRQHLQSMGWNFVCSKRIRQHGVETPVIGDLVVLPEHKDKVFLRRDEVTRIETEEELRRCSIGDVVLPLPHPSFVAKEDFPHCDGASYGIYKQVYGKLSCPQFLTQPESEMPLLFSHGRGGARPLYRRMVSRPQEMQWSTLRCVKTPTTARIVFNDRLLLQRDRPVSDDSIVSSFSDDPLQGISSPSAPTSSFASTDIRANRFVQSMPLTPDPEVIAAFTDVVLHGQLQKHHQLDIVLREIFALRGIISTEDSRLQHRIHYRVTQLDLDWASCWEAPACFCCYSRSHHMLRHCVLHSHRMASKREREALAVEMKLVEGQTPRSQSSSSRQLPAATSEPTSPPPPTPIRTEPSSPPSVVFVNISLSRRSTTEALGIEVENSLHITRVIPGSVLATHLLKRQRADVSAHEEALFCAVERLISASSDHLPEDNNSTPQIFVKSANGFPVATRSEFKDKVRNSLGIDLQLMGVVSVAEVSPRSKPQKRELPSSRQKASSSSSRGAAPRRPQIHRMLLERSLCTESWGLEVLPTLKLSRIVPGSPAAKAVADCHHYGLPSLVADSSAHHPRWVVHSVNSAAVRSFRQLKQFMKDASEAKLLRVELRRQ